MSRFYAETTQLPGLWIIGRKSLTDSRGSLSRLFCADELKEFGWIKPIAQINQTITLKKGAVRGMHFQQPPHAEMKMVSCIRGEVWDVAIDIRTDSPTFLQCHAERLSAENQHSLLIPEGFAHGFQTLTDNVEMLYFHSMAYTPAADAGLNPQDPQLGIAWPLKITELSTKDQTYPLIATGFKGVQL